MRKRLKWLVPIIVLAALAGTFIVYTGDYYRADDAALRALESFGGVRVMRTGYGYRFDGPSEDAALVFYPGGKVEAEAYAPFLRRLAASGVDVCLVRMPFRLALFGIDSADAVMAQHDYPRWYVGGHSLGGAMAAAYATHHGNALAGVVLCAAYPTGALDQHMTEICVYGSEDGVLDPKRLEASRAYAPETCFEHVIEGGNHAQFGNYGPQRGDGAATISAEEQQRAAAAYIVSHIGA